MSQKTTKRKPKQKRKPKAKATPAAPAPQDLVAALKKDAEDRRQKCGRAVNGALQQFDCELVASPVFVFIGNDNHAVQCTFDIRAKVKA